MKQVFIPAFLEGIAIPGLNTKAARPAFEGRGRPISIDAAELAAAAAVAAARQKRGVK
jgi:hypothetical protein